MPRSRSASDGARSASIRSKALPTSGACRRIDSATSAGVHTQVQASPWWVGKTPAKAPSWRWYSRPSQSPRWYA